MGVHHHPDLHHKRKKFREYFLEFLMIFLGVTLGFLAENFREHPGDRNKENEYIRGMMEDLEDDQQTLKNQDLQATGADLISFLKKEYRLENE